MLDTFAAHSKFSCKDSITAAIIILTGHTSATSLAFSQMADRASLTYKVLHTGTPSKLSERLHPYVPSRTLQSSSSANLYVPHTNLHFGSCSFHIAAPTVLNFLPSTIRSSQTLNTFQNKNILKPIFSSLHLIAPSDLSSASNSFY